ncbi:MAG: hypothetical protein ACTSVZ_01270 [Promethearchaeota archaeon]
MTKNVKENIISFLKTLPDDVTIEDIMYHLYVRKKIQRGLEDVKEGRTVTHEEMRDLINTWNT